MNVMNSFDFDNAIYCLCMCRNMANALMLKIHSIQTNRMNNNSLRIRMKNLYIDASIRRIFAIIHMFLNKHVSIQQQQNKQES